MGYVFQHAVMVASCGQMPQSDSCVLISYEQKLQKHFETETRQR